MGAINLVPRKDRQLCQAGDRRRRPAPATSTRCTSSAGSVAPKIVFQRGLLDLPEHRYCAQARGLSARTPWIRPSRPCLTVLCQA